MKMMLMLKSTVIAILLAELAMATSECKAAKRQRQVKTLIGLNIKEEKALDYVRQLCPICGPKDRSGWSGTEIKDWRCKEHQSIDLVSAAKWEKMLGNPEEKEVHDWQHGVEVTDDQKWIPRDGLIVKSIKATVNDRAEHEGAYTRYTHEERPSGFSKQYWDTHFKGDWYYKHGALCPQCTQYKRLGGMKVTNCTDCAVTDMCIYYRKGYGCPGRWNLGLMTSEGGDDYYSLRCNCCKGTGKDPVYGLRCSFCNANQRFKKPLIKSTDDGEFLTGGQDAAWTRSDPSNDDFPDKITVDIIKQ